MLSKYKCDLSTLEAELTCFLRLREIQALLIQTRTERKEIVTSLL